MSEGEGASATHKSTLGGTPGEELGKTGYGKTKGNGFNGNRRIFKGPAPR